MTILGVYLLFTVERDWFFDHWIAIERLSEFLLCMTAASMIGRVFGIWRSTKRMFRKRGTSERPINN